MLTDVDQHRSTRGDTPARRRSGDASYGFGSVTAIDAGIRTAATARAVYRHRYRDGAVIHGAQPGVDGYMAGCRCSQCCSAQHAREDQVSAFFARRHHT